ncbi:MAG: ATP-binding cassette domain-containing protein [Acholeplasmataceae bacterium]
MMNSIEMDHVYSNIGNFELKDINLNIPKGNIIGVVGKNGAGKTTLFKTINGSYIQTSGKLSIHQMSYQNYEKQIKEILSVVYDTFNVNPYAKIKMIKKTYQKIHPHFNVDIFDTLTDKYHIDLNKRIKSFSFGEIRKFMLILALSTQPKILLLDEPFIGIDPIDKKEFIDLLQTYMENEDHTMMISSHQVEDIEKIADYILFINQGEIILFEDKETLLDKYVNVKMAYSDENQKYLINPIKNSLGIEGLIETHQAKALGLEYQRTNIEQIFINLCR